MFRPIRRTKNEISPEDAQGILEAARWGVLAVHGDEGYPYGVPINFIYDRGAGKIFFHGAKAGHKADALRACGKVCFTVCGEEFFEDGAWAPYVRSTVVFGTCRLMAPGPEAEAALKRLAMKYYPSEALADEEIARSGKAVQLFEIDIEHLSGKQVQER